MLSGLLFIFVGFVGLILSFTHWGGLISLLAGWASSTIVAMGLAYGFTGPCLMGKRADGRIAWYGWFVFWPFHLVNYLRFRLYWAVTDEAPWHEVAPGIFIGRALMGHDRSKLLDAQLAAVLDLTAEFEESAWVDKDCAYCCVPLLDTRAASSDCLSDCVDWLQAQRAHGAVYIHCAMGHGRSALIVSALLLARGEAANASEAIQCICRKRSRARLHEAQRRAIEAWLHQLSQ